MFAVSYKTLHKSRKLSTGKIKAQNPKLKIMFLSNIVTLHETD